MWWSLWFVPIKSANVILFKSVISDASGKLEIKNIYGHFQILWKRQYVQNKTENRLWRLHVELVKVDNSGPAFFHRILPHKNISIHYCLKKHQYTVLFLQKVSPLNGCKTAVVVYFLYSCTFGKVWVKVWVEFSTLWGLEANIYPAWYLKTQRKSPAHGELRAELRP